VIFAVLYL